MEKLENSRSEKIISGFKNKRILLQFSLIKYIIDLLRILKILNYLKLTGR